ATTAAHDASVHADAAAQAAAQAGAMSKVSAAESRRSAIAADKAKRAAATAKSAALAAQAIVQQALAAANEAKAAADKSAAHADAAAVAAEEAAAHAGEAANWADLATRHAEAAGKAADDANTAANQAANVEATARQTEQAALESTTALSVLAAEEEARKEPAAQVAVAWERAESARQDEDTKRLLTEATALGTVPETAILKSRQAAVRLLKSGAPWTAKAAEAALIGSDEEVRTWLTTNRQLAAAQDDYSKVSYLAFSEVPALRSAAEQALTGTPQAQAAFLESGQHSAMREEYRVQILTLMNAGGVGVRERGSAAMDVGTPQALLAFLTTGQHSARREDDRVEALKLINSGTPRVKAAAQV
ncbi:ALF repeat-containing protein, partial [Lysinibacillus fusiformis]|uniref:ALF repeat-containing protein n=2 Tax=Bacillati TaxID=1783272 RepID=UPI0037FDACAB